MKKRSLFVATAMLLVAVIVATSATYAWFTTVKEAKVTVSMDVADGSSLEISVDGGDWASTAEIATGEWTDASIGKTEGKYGSLYKADFNDPANKTNVTGYHVAADNEVESVTIEFRSTVKGDIVVKKGQIKALAGTTVANDLLTYANILVVNGTGETAPRTVYSQNATTVTAGIVGTSTTDIAEYTTTKLEGATIVTMNKVGDYYTGVATFYFFIEGTTTDNLDLAATSDNARIVADITFEQEASS